MVKKNRKQLFKLYNFEFSSQNTYKTYYWEKKIRAKKLRQRKLIRHFFTPVFLLLRFFVFLNIKKNKI